MSWLKGRRLALLAMAILLLTLISNLPAQLVWRQVQPHLPANVELSGLTGTLWRGSVARLQVDGIDQGALDWRWQPAGLLAAELELDLNWRPRDGQVGAVLRLGAAEVSLENVRGRLSAASMAQVNKAPFVLQGDWLLDIPQLTLENLREVTRASGRIAWQDAGGGLPNPLALGNLAADLGTDNGWLVMQLTDAGGPLGLSGSARWQPAKPLKLDTRLQARADAERDLAAGLQLLGRADPQGWVRWRAQLQ
ncbi:MAG: type II secretion system protein N [Pseudomonadaceae bacterium]